MADEKKWIVVHNTKELLEAVKECPDGSKIVFDEVDDDRYGMAASAVRHAEAMFNKAQTTLDKLDPLVEAKKKEDRERLKLLQKEQKRWR